MKHTNVALIFTIILLGLGAQATVARADSDRGASPKIEYLPLQRYVAIHRNVSKAQLSEAISAGIGQVANWLAAHGERPAGPPFVRYLVIAMPEHLDIEIGFPIAAPVKATAPLVEGAFPAGRYVTYTYTGGYDGLVDANGEVLRWAQKKNLVLEHKQSGQGDVWGAREEIYLTDPSRVHDPKKYRTKILFGLAK
jgi:effector-binding domain-containing protein